MTAEPPEPTPQPPRWLLAPVFAAHFLCALGFSALALMPKYLITERGLSQAETGPVTMAGPLGVLVFSPLVSYAMRRLTLARIVRVSAWLSALLALAFTQHPPLAALPVLALLAGAATMGVYNAGSALVAEVSPVRGMARALGFYGAAGMAGYAIGPAVIEPLAARAGWAWAFAFAALAAVLGGMLPLPRTRPSEETDTPGARAARQLGGLGGLVLVCVLCGLMHNALWVAHQPLVLARGGHAVQGYFLGMSGGALAMRLGFSSLPDRVGPDRSALAALVGYVLVTLAMTWVTPTTLPLLGLAHGLAHGVFYPSMAAVLVRRVRHSARGHALTLQYAAFNLGATAASLSFARLGHALGPASVFPCAALLGVVGVALLSLLIFRESAAHSLLAFCARPALVLVPCLRQRLGVGVWHELAHAARRIARGLRG